MLDQRKLETLFRIGCPDNLIIELLKTGKFVPTGDSLIDDNLESLIDHKIFNNNNWGGKREGAGRPKNNQVENQVGNQVGNQDTDKDIKQEYNIYNKYNNKLSGINNNISTTRTRANEDKKLLTPHNMLEIFGNSLKGTDAVVDVFEKSDGTTKEGIRIKNLALLAFVRQRFNKKTLERVSDWAIDHNQRGYTYNASSLLKLFCKFQKDIEPTINYNHVQLEYLKFDYKGEKSSGNTTIS